MRYELIEDKVGWIVRCEGQDLARFDAQSMALDDIARRLKAADTSVPSSVAVRYQTRTA